MKENRKLQQLPIIIHEVICSCIYCVNMMNHKLKYKQMLETFCQKQIAAVSVRFSLVDCGGDGELKKQRVIAIKIKLEEDAK